MTKGSHQTFYTKLFTILKSKEKGRARIAVYCSFSLLEIGLNEYFLNVDNVSCKERKHLLSFWLIENKPFSSVNSTIYKSFEHFEVHFISNCDLLNFLGDHPSQLPESLNFRIMLTIQANNIFGNNGLTDVEPNSFCRRFNR